MLLIIIQKHRRDESALDDNNAVIDYNVTSATTNLFKIKEKTIGQTGNNDTKNVEIMVPLKYPSNFSKTFEMPLINCEINHDLNWSKRCVLVATSAAEQLSTFSITDTKLHVSVVTLSTQDNTKLLEQLKSGFKRTINWNKINQKYQQKDQINI